jgi:23S rRNA pseudouridine1911/1915/1917 synthase
MSAPSSNPEHLAFGPVAIADSGQRLDAWLARQHPALSRVRWQELIKQSCVLVNGAARKPNHGLAPGDHITAEIPPAVEVGLIPEDIALDILHEDADIMVINKPAGLVVHPAPGHAAGTLVHALLHHCHDLAGIGGEKRPGIVHRLDRDTSGVMVIAKNERAMRSLTAQFKERSTRKDYIAVVWGTPSPANGKIETTIGRDPVHRQKMSVRSTRGRSAITHYRTLKTHEPLSLLAIRIETGRTHQIRVHLAHIKHPVVGDAAYGRKRPPPLPYAVTRQLLHAWKLSLRHPASGEVLTFEAPWPADITALI